MATPHVPRKYTLLTLSAARRQLERLTKSHNPDAKQSQRLSTHC